jgi:hypothetical protein
MQAPVLFFCWHRVLLFLIEDQLECNTFVKTQLLFDMFGLYYPFWDNLAARLAASRTSGGLFVI